MKAALKTIRRFWTGNFWRGVSHADRRAIDLAFEILDQTERLMTPAARDVLAERRRQVEEEGWTAELDDKYTEHQLPRAAAVYAAPVLISERVRIRGRDELFWPWAAEWYKPTDRRRDLVKAASLLLAEIERLDRQTLREDQK